MSHSDCQHPRSQTHLSRLLDRAAKGEPFIIANASKQLTKVVPREIAGRRSASPSRVHRRTDRGA
jgi:antitoxin (DNA-binding transcriptional repressor) of toxin-antitoxin stability system